MFELRMTYARELSDTLREMLGRKQILEKDLLTIGKEIAENLGCYFEIAEAKFDKNEFKARIEYLPDEKTYLLILNKDISINHHARWFFIAHEIGHLVLHRDLMCMPLICQSAEVEEQANFFARLCFWPMEKITYALVNGQNPTEIKNLSIDHQKSPTLSAQKSYAREDLCHVLTTFAVQTYKKEGWVNDYSESNMLRYSNEFINTLDI